MSHVERFEIARISVVVVQNLNLQLKWKCWEKSWKQMDSQEKDIKKQLSVYNTWISSVDGVCSVVIDESVDMKVF